MIDCNYDKNVSLIHYIKLGLTTFNEPPLLPLLPLLPRLSLLYLFSILFSPSSPTIFS